jgi:MerR family regulatory protein
MKIGELAGRSGLNSSAIRYYEKMGLLSSPHRVGASAGTRPTHSTVSFLSASPVIWGSP